MQQDPTLKMHSFIFLTIEHLKGFPILRKGTKRNAQEHHHMVIRGRTETTAGISSKARAHLHKANNCVRKASNFKGSLHENHYEMKT